MKLKEYIDNRIKTVLIEGQVDRFKIGDKVEVTSLFPDMAGKQGTIIDIDKGRGQLYVDFHKPIQLRYAKSWDLDGKIDTETGFLFASLNWITRQFDTRFSIKSLKIIK